VLLITQVNAERDLGAVEHALERLHFEPEASRDGWRWRGRKRMPATDQARLDLRRARSFRALTPREFG
jgi:hypothetical protein